MNTPPLQTENLILAPQSREKMRAYVEHMSPQEKAELSPVWLDLLDGSSISDPWIHGFVLVDRITGGEIGRCGFKGPPGTDGMVEIAYGVDPVHQGKGYATEAAEALVRYALSHETVQTVRAHTLPQSDASARVLAKCGFQRRGEVVDPEDGLVWRWEYQSDGR